ncbi:MAG: RDD family protein [Flavobacteriales bacterium]|nr:RDD family protein [Flavobacteriales bacterium]
MAGTKRAGSLPRRCVAFIIDGVLFLIVEKVFGSAGLLVGEEFWFLLMEAYLVFMQWRYGATLGKMLLKLKVVDSLTYSRFTLKRSFLRELPYILDIVIGYVLAQVASGFAAWSDNLMAIFVLADIISAVFDEHNRTLCDRLAGTVVVRVD